MQLARDVLRKHNYHHSNYLHGYHHRDHLWLVDHYLGKDLALCLPALKHTAIAPLRRLFTSSGMLNGHYVGCVRASFLDTSTLAGRSGYFDSVGITRDILQVG